MNRTEAIEVVDTTNAQFAEMCRHGACPVCESLMEVTPVTGEDAPESLQDFHGREPDGYLEWASTHAKDCRLIFYIRNLATLQQIFQIRSETVREIVRLPDGSARAFLREVRIPDPGDPPVPE